MFTQEISARQLDAIHAIASRRSGQSQFLLFASLHDEFETDFVA